MPIRRRSATIAGVASAAARAPRVKLCSTCFPSVRVNDLYRGTGPQQCVLEGALSEPMTLKWHCAWQDAKEQQREAIACKTWAAISGNCRPPQTLSGSAPC